jgi:hypothetical protein
MMIVKAPSGRECKAAHNRDAAADRTGLDPHQGAAPFADAI